MLLYDVKMHYVVLLLCNVLSKILPEIKSVLLACGKMHLIENIVTNVPL